MHNPYDDNFTFKIGYVDGTIANTSTSGIITNVPPNTTTIQIGTIEVHDQAERIETTTRLIMETMAGSGAQTTAVELWASMPLGTQRDVIARLETLPPPASFNKERFAYERVNKRAGYTDASIDIFWYGYSINLPTIAIREIENTSTMMIQNMMSALIVSYPSLYPYIDTITRMLKDDLSILQQVSEQHEHTGATISALWIAPTIFVPDRLYSLSVASTTD